MANRSKTWWGQEFLSALENFMDSGRLSRGRSYSTPRRLVKFSMTGNVAKATVEGNVNPYFGVYETPYYKAEVTLAKISQRDWRVVLKRLGTNANWVTHLLLGEVPPTIERAFAGTRHGLLPKTGREIESKCSCPDWANPCKHVAGVYYRVAGMIDHDPLVLFELRGLPREKLFEAVKKSEFGSALASTHIDSEPDLEAMTVQSRLPSVATMDPDIDLEDQRRFWLGSGIPRSATTSRLPPPVSVLPMRREGDHPQFWHDNVSFIETMGDAYTRIAGKLPNQPARITDLFGD